MTDYNNIHMSIHGADGVRLLSHHVKDDTEWVEIEIGHMRITLFEREAIDDALHLPRSDDFTTNIEAQEAA